MSSNGVKEAKKQKNQDGAVTETATQATEKSAPKQPCGCCGGRKETK